MSNHTTNLVAQVAAMSPADGERVRKLVTAGSISYLSPEKEVGPFMLFLLGDSLEAVAEKTQYPRDIILVTAAHYRWDEKKSVLVQTGKESELIKDIEKNLLNMMLLATYKAFSKEIGEVMAGKKNASDCRFIPSSMQGLGKLLEMVEKANKLVALDKPPETQQPQTVVHAQNVQIVNNNGEMSQEEKRRLYLQKMAQNANSDG